MHFNTRIDRQFKRRPDGFYQEIYCHYVQITQEKGDIITKLDKIIPGGLYRKAADSEHSVDGEVIWLNPDDGISYKLIGIRTADG